VSVVVAASPAREPALVVARDSTAPADVSDSVTVNGRAVVVVFRLAAATGKVKSARVAALASTETAPSSAPTGTGLALVALLDETVLPPSTVLLLRLKPTLTRSWYSRM
jgi:hypothetical protein